MATLAVSGTQARSLPDRAVLRAELEATQDAVQRWLATLTDEQWRRKAVTSAWTVAEVFVHLTGALEYLPEEVASAKRGQGMFNYPKFVSNPYSYWSTRLEARRATRPLLARRYAAAMAKVLQTLDTVQDGEWSLGANFYGEGYYTVADLFHTPAQHLAEHTQGL
jgi:hypothetical protein